MAGLKRAACAVDGAGKKSKTSMSAPPAKKPRRSDATEKDTRRDVSQTKAALPKPLIASSLIQTERSFPRGGASALTPLERKQAQLEAERDVLFEEAGAKKARAANGAEDDEEGGVNKEDRRSREKQKKRKRTELAPAADHDEDKVAIESLGFKKITIGTQVLGQVVQITDKDIALALPNNLTGYAPITSISDRFSKTLEDIAKVDDEGSEDGAEDESAGRLSIKGLVTKGQYLRAVVISTGEEAAPGVVTSRKKHIELSVKPQDANAGLSKSDLVPGLMLQASVRSVEDHGLVMDLGLEDSESRGFLPTKELQAGTEASKMREGSVLLCLVTAVSSNGQVIKLSTDHRKVSDTTKYAVKAAPSIDAFQPGTVADILITKVEQSGLAGKIMGLLDATADLIHSGACQHGEDLSTKYKIGSRVKARVICTFTTSEKRKIGVSVLNNVLTLSSQQLAGEGDTSAPPKSLPISSFVEEAKVIRVEPRIGLFLDVGIEGAIGFAHVSRVSDDKSETISTYMGSYKPDSVHRARVLSYNPLDGQYQVSLQKSVLNQAILRLEDLIVGQKIKVTVQEILRTGRAFGGAIVQVAEGITGLIPEMHLSDVRLQEPERKGFKPGAPVHVRVLSMDLERRRLRFTAKKSIVNSTEEIWDDYSRVKPGAHSQGTIFKMLAQGAVIQFYGSVRGYLPPGEMTDAFVEDLKQHFHEGQVVRVRCLNVEPSEGRMTVSCKDASTVTDEQQQAFNELETGSIVTGTVNAKSDDKIQLALKPSGVNGVLRLGQLSDGLSQQNEMLMQKFKIGQTLSNMVVLEKADRSPTVFLSNKPSLIQAAKAGSLVRSAADVRNGMEVRGFVRSIRPDCVFVAFANGAHAMMRKDELLEDQKGQPSFGLDAEQSITAYAYHVNYEKQQFMLSMSKPEKKNNPGAAEKKVNPDAKDNLTMESFTTGVVYKATVRHVKATHLNVQLADKVFGRVDVSELFSDICDISNLRQPLAQFKPKEEIDVQVVGTYNPTTHRYLPITHRGTGKASIFELSVKSAAGKDQDRLSIEKLQQGQECLAFINNFSKGFAWVSLSCNVSGRISLADLTDDASLLANVNKNFPKGSALKARVTGINVEKGRVDLVAASKAATAPTKFKEIKPGMIMPATITRVTDRNLMATIAEGVWGSVERSEVADDYDQADLSKFSKGDTITVKAITADPKVKKTMFTMRPSQLQDSEPPVKDPQILNIEQVKLKDILRGFVISVGPGGIFVHLGPGIQAYVQVSQLSEEYVEDWQPEFPIGKVVRGKVILADYENKFIRMSLKSSVLESDDFEITDLGALASFNSFNIGDVVTGKIKKVLDNGVIVEVDDAKNVSGLCHIREVADSKIEQLDKLYAEGDAVKALVVGLDPQKRRIKFSLKASRLAAAEAKDGVDDFAEFSDDDDAAAEGDEIAEDDDEGGVNLEDVLDMDAAAVKELNVVDEDDEEGEDGYEDAVENMDVDTPALDLTVGLKTTGFDWTGATLDADRTDAMSIASEISQPASHSKKRTVDPDAIQTDRTGDLDLHGPQTASDFERLLLASPNDSHLWLKYMQHVLEHNDIDAARSLGDRALRTIRIEEQDEKLNIWTALLNLEVTFGTGDALDDTFTRACEFSDSEELHRRFVNILIESGKNDKAETVFTSMLTKAAFKSDPSFWLNYATFLMSTLALPDHARALLHRASQSVRETEQRSLTARFGALEFKSPHGDPERGRTIFENLLSIYPKKGDLWDQFVSLEDSRLQKMKADGVGKDDVDAQREKVRALWERVTRAGGMKGKRPKLVFSRWRDFERKEDGAKGVTMVERKEKEWFEERKKADEDDE